MKLVFDSTALLYFSKLGILGKMQGLAECFIPNAVYEEVVLAGKKKGEKDPLVVEGLVGNGAFTVVSLKSKSLFNKLLKFANLSPADCEVLAVSHELPGTAVIDDSDLRAIASLEGIKFHGSVFLLFSLCRKNKLSKAQVRKHFDDMISLGWHCSTRFYSSVLLELEKL